LGVGSLVAASLMVVQQVNTVLQVGLVFLVLSAKGLDFTLDPLLLSGLECASLVLLPLLSCRVQRTSGQHDNTDGETDSPLSLFVHRWSVAGTTLFSGLDYLNSNAMQRIKTFQDRFTKRDPPAS
jgi:hypothetical protein